MIHGLDDLAICLGDFGGVNGSLLASVLREPRETDGGVTVTLLKLEARSATGQC